MKKIFLLLFAAVCTMASWAQATVGATVKGETLTVALNDDGQKFVAFQMDIQLPADVTIADDNVITMMTDRLTKPGTASAIDASETVDFKMAYNLLSGNKLRVIAYNLENREIAGNSGDPLFTVALKGTSEVAISIDNIKFVTKTALAEVDLNDVIASEAEGTLSFDVNGDEDFDVFDVQDLLDMVASNAPYDSRFDFFADGELDIFDVQELLDIYAAQ